MRPPWRQCPIPSGLASSKYFDELYTYDGLYQLKTFARGYLNTAKDGITSGLKTLAQDWTFDATGNWTAYKEDLDGNGTWELEQTRAHNKANEVGVIGATTGSNWIDPVHDRAGNMTTAPGSSDPTSSRTGTYDAWNRLVYYVAAQDNGGRFAYDGLNRRIRQETIVDENPTATRHYYYSANWQVLEERLGTSPNTASAERQFVWGLRYIDDLVLRDRNADGVGTSLEERIYALQDANWNVTTICESDGDVAERYAYTAYGETYLLTDLYVRDSQSPYDWETRYAGYRWDGVTGLYCVRNRWLHSVLGRWVSRDPFPDSVEARSYEYSFGNPIVHTDFMGTKPMKNWYVVTSENTGAAHGADIKYIVDKARQMMKERYHFEVTHVEYNTEVQNTFKYNLLGFGIPVDVEKPDSGHGRRVVDWVRRKVMNPNSYPLIFTSGGLTPSNTRPGEGVIINLDELGRLGREHYVYVVAHEMVAHEYLGYKHGNNEEWEKGLTRQREHGEGARNEAKDGKVSSEVAEKICDVTGEKVDDKFIIKPKRPRR